MYDKEEMEYINQYNENLNLLYDILEENNLLDKINDENNCFLFFDEAGKLKNAAATLKHADKRVSGKIDKSWNSIIKALKNFIIGDEREEIVTNRTKMSSLIKRLLALGPTFFIPGIGPLIGILSAATLLIVKKKLTKREKLRLLKELDSELVIVDEKIKDADADGNKKAKYSLMRLRGRMVRDMERIKYCSTI